MSFDIPLHIPDNSPEANAIQLVMDSEKVGAEEAVLSILRRAKAPGRMVTLKRVSKSVPEPRNATRLPDLSIAKEHPIFGVFADNSEYLAELDKIISDRGKRYTKFA